MTQGVVSGGSSNGGDREEIREDVVKALESVGVSGEVAAALTNTIIESGGIEALDENVQNDGLPLSDNARFIIEKRYLRRDDDGSPIEDPDGLFRRVSNAVALGEPEVKQAEYEQKYYEIMSNLKFLPNSPTLVNAGTGRGCLSACIIGNFHNRLNIIFWRNNEAG